jgi:tripartite-type tricarboxylate transporter receptor subunit TctC
MKLLRRQFLHLAAGAVALPAVSRVASAQTYPSRPVHLIVGFAPGGGNDIVARLMGQWLSEQLGQQFVIENRPGAGTNIATEAVVNARPDGYTLLLVASSAAINATLYKKLNFNFIRDIAPVAGIIRLPNVMLVNPSFPAKTVPEFIAYAKANPGKISMASSGNGSSTQVAGELFKMMTGIDMVHVPYRGTGPDRSARRASAGHVSPHGLAHRVHQVRQAACIRGDNFDALGSAAGHPDHRRLRAGLRSKRLVRRRRAQEHAR